MAKLDKSAPDYDPKEEPLTDRQKLFIDAYCRHFNKSRAALEAGYSESCSKRYGWDLYHKPHVKAEIDRIVESQCMGKFEVLNRLGNIARGDVGEMLTETENGGAVFDYAKAKEQTSLIRKLKTKSRSLARSDDEDSGIIEVETDVELYSALDALVQIGRHLGLFTDKSEISGPGGGPLQIVAADELAQARARAVAEEKKLLGNEQ
jgi:phage terminase small subunit